MKRIGWVVAVAALALPLLWTPDAAASADPSARVDSGLLRGTGDGSVDSFRGVPYAQPPVGALRWRAPQPAQRWHGVRDATAYGGRCPVLASTNGPRSETEDCLYLNVWRPAGSRPGARLPVYFWIHGGGLVNGSSNQHDGSLIARTTGVVVVSVNYRLGVFGFLAHPALTDQAGQSGNYGLMDQQAALRWVHDNIAAFGGDPHRVTIGGESAGGWSVCAHLSAPASRGLFARAMIQSGSCTSQTLADAQTAGTAYARVVGCTDDATAAACLRGRTTAQLLDTAPAPPSRFVRDVPVLPQDPDTAVRTGAFARVPVVVGATRDEGRTFAQGFIGATRAQYEAWVQGQFGTRTPAVLARYPWPADADRFTPAYLIGAIFTDSGLLAGIGGCGNRSLTRALAASTRTFSYEFAHRTGPGLSPQPAGYVWGAGHAAELAYLWPSFDNGTPIAPTFTADEKRLALDMVRYWGSFVRTGQPAAAHSAPWPPYNHTGLTLSLRAGGRSTLISDREYAAEHNCDLWTP
ncbi:carboxylesterase/lipase family protein [Planosporangium mesophilum]|uniref:Carboxylic ester hydrolase n=1 Tax=Planosporangium mesophilum TaxID=689768 RepID=A0A8J3TCP6_9ACTN|nr:carboxylesterase family protein [Planosporangium mesophilum]NJC85475.1 carboxylesterase family protein [Planosporangium mesophilum]GII24013.1 carboxylic ester hydrolase [Planosporangium mesophilum]